MFAPLLRRLKRKIIFRVTKNDDVEFYWLIATAYFEIYEAEVHQELLYKIVEAYDSKRLSYAKEGIDLIGFVGD